MLSTSQGENGSCVIVFNYSASEINNKLGTQEKYSPS
jgi:hypothetical protein